MHAQILKKDSRNKKSKVSIRRISGIHARFDNINTNMLNKFTNISDDNEYMEFEKWLLKI